MKNNKIKKILCIPIFILLFSLLLYNIVLITGAIINPDKTPSFFGIKTYVIVSGSMQPEINIGDMVVVKEVNDTELNVGDIISYRNGQSVVTHRIHQINYVNGKKEYITKGDYNNTQDSIIITIDSIEGKVIKTFKGIGHISLFLQSKYSIIIITIIFFIYLLSRKNKSDNIEILKDMNEIEKEEMEELMDDEII